MGVDVNTYKPAAVAATVSRAKNLLVGPAQYASDKDFRLRDEKAGRPMTARIYQLYSERCRAASAMDFDDLLYYMNVLMRDQPEVCDALRRRFRYILVDEYQDTNLAQHSIIRRLTEGSNGLTVVGDDAQSIYSFRGANISNILALEKQYPGLRTSSSKQTTARQRPSSKPPIRLLRRMSGRSRNALSALSAAK